jgi:hypothetical protein
MAGCSKEIDANAACPCLPINSFASHNNNNNNNTYSTYLEFQDTSSSLGRYRAIFNESPKFRSGIAICSDFTICGPSAAEIDLQFWTSEKQVGSRGEVSSVPGDTAGDADVYIDGTRVLAKLSCKLADIFEDLQSEPGVTAGLLPLAAVFSLVTRPLSWTS